MEKETQKKPVVAKAQKENATKNTSEVVAVEAKTEVKTESKLDNKSNQKPAFNSRKFDKPRRFNNNYRGNNFQGNRQNKPVVEEKFADRPEIELPELDKFLQAGVHFGHKSSRWHPKMAQYIYDVRGGVHIIDLVKSMKMLKEALKKMQHSSDRGNILIVGTKGQAASLVSDLAQEVGAFYVNKRWPGGLFTNFDVIKRSLDKLMKMEEHLAKGGVGLVKKEQILMERDIARLNNLYSGIKFMDKLPLLVIVIDSKVEKNAIAEAKAAGVPVVALVDTNCDPTQIDYPIPANDDSIRSLKLFVELFGKAIAGGKRADSLKALRQDYVARLEKTITDYKAEVEKKKAMEEADRERLKILRKGDSLKVSADKVEVKNEVVRMVEKKKATK